MYDREHARAVIAEIIAHDLSIRLWVDAGGQLHITGPGRLADQQKFLIKAHRDEVIWYLRTPPEQVGVCRRGHPIKWRCTKGGTWVCACFFEVYVPKKPSRYPGLKDYWEVGRTAQSSQ